MKGMLIMGAFFAIQVQTGQEIQVKDMMEKVLSRFCWKEEPIIKSIYASETYTETIKSDKINFDSIEMSLNKDDTEKYIHYRKLQSHVNNLKIAYDALGTKDSELKKSYKESIRNINAEIRKMRKQGIKKMKSVMDGYILIELVPNSHYLPDLLWHAIKQIPKVINILSKWSIPQEEV